MSLDPACFQKDVLDDQSFICFCIICKIYSSLEIKNISSYLNLKTLLYFQLAKNTYFGSGSKFKFRIDNTPLLPKWIGCGLPA
jgi:hypothetical protein